jgi:2'-5' RNA ligase
LPETALICRVPEAEPFISRYRARFDPSARRNVPAHVTILYPFIAPTRVDEHVISSLTAVARSIRCFDYRLAEAKRFPVALWLAPAPDDSFAALMAAVYRAFPEFPPFEGKFDTVVPHVTVAHGDEPQLCEIDLELKLALPRGGIVARCDEMLLIENSSGRWEPMHTFDLGASPDSHDN